MKTKEKETKKITVILAADVHHAASLKLAQLGGIAAGYSFQTVLAKLVAEWVQDSTRVRRPS